MHFCAELTFARLHALRPTVIHVSVAGTSAGFKPSTARSATTESAGLLERPALWTHHRISDPRGAAWQADRRGDWHPDY